MSHAAPVGNTGGANWFEVVPDDRGTGPLSESPAKPPCQGDSFTTEGLNDRRWLDDLDVRGPLLAQSWSPDGGAERPERPSLPPGLLPPDPKPPQAPARVPSTGIDFGIEGNQYKINVLPGREVPGIGRSPWPAPALSVPVGRPIPMGRPEPNEAVDKMLEEAEVSLKDGENSKARGLALKVIGIDPRNETAHFIVFLSHVAEGDLRGAAKRVRLFGQEAPASGVYALARGMLETQRERYMEAIPWLEKAKKSLPGRLEACQQLAVAYSSSGDKVKAAAVINGFTTSTREERAEIAILFALLVDFKEGALRLEKIAEESPANADILGNAAWSLLRIKKKDEAVRMMDKALAINPGQYQALSAKLGLLWDANLQKAPDPELGRLAKEILQIQRGQRDLTSRGNFRLILKPIPSSLNVNFYWSRPAIVSILAKHYYDTLQWGLAEPLFEELRGSDPGSYSTYPPYAGLVMLATTKSRLGKTQEADLLFREAFALKPDDHDEEDLLAEYIVLMGNMGWPERAKPYLEKFRKVAPSSKKVLTLFVYGSLLLADGRFNEAETSLRLAVEARPKDPQFRTTLAVILWAQGKKAAAVEEARHSLSLSVSSAVPYMILIEDASTRGDYKELGRLTDEFLSHFPDQVDLAYKVGKYLLQSYFDLTAQKGLSPLTAQDEEKTILDLAHKFVNAAVITQGAKAVPEARINLLEILYLKGEATAETSEKLAKGTEFYDFINPHILLLLQDGPREDVLEELGRVIDKNKEHLAFQVAMLYPFLRHGRVDAARAVLLRYWDRKGSSLDTLIPALTAITGHPYPGPAAPLVATVHARLGDWFYTQNKLKEALGHYQKAKDLDASEEQAWIGLIRTYRAMGKSSKAGQIEGEFSRRFRGR